MIGAPGKNQKQKNSTRLTHKHSGPDERSQQNKVKVSTSKQPVEFPQPTQAHYGPSVTGRGDRVHLSSLDNIKNNPSRIAYILCTIILLQFMKDRKLTQWHSGYLSNLNSMTSNLYAAVSSLAASLAIF